MPWRTILIFPLPFVERILPKRTIPQRSVRWVFPHLRTNWYRKLWGWYWNLCMNQYFWIVRTGLDLNAVVILHWETSNTSSTERNGLSKEISKGASTTSITRYWLSCSKGKSRTHGSRSWFTNFWKLGIWRTGGIRTPIVARHKVELFPLSLQIYIYTSLIFLSWS